jgi:hypothetical protein
MSEYLYGQNSLVIAAVLLLSMAATINLGHRLGETRHASSNERFHSHVNGVQASVLGVLALLLGFTFSLALQRFDDRSEAVIHEANAIGTSYLRAQLLPASVRSDVRKMLREYVDLRVQTGAISLDNEAERQVLLARANQVLDTLWVYALHAAEDDCSMVTTGLFIQSLNDTIDSLGRRDAELNRHVPEVVFLLLYGTFLVTGGLVGYAAGVAGHKPSLAAYVLVALIVVLSFIIIDLDRPRRGLICVDQESMVNLKLAIDTAESLGDQQTLPADTPRPAVTGRR